MQDEAEEAEGSNSANGIEVRQPGHNPGPGDDDDDDEEGGFDLARFVPVSVYLREIG